VGWPENTVPFTTPRISIFLVYLFSIKNGDDVSVNALNVSLYISLGRFNCSYILGKKEGKTALITLTSTDLIISSCWFLSCEEPSQDTKIG